MEQILKQNIITLIQMHHEATGLAMTTISGQATGYSRFHMRLEDGATFTVRTYDTIVAWFKANWQSSTPFPDFNTNSGEVNTPASLEYVGAGLCGAAPAPASDLSCNVAPTLNASEVTP